jgi:hypothetical protein
MLLRALGERGILRFILLPLVSACAAECVEHSWHAFTFERATGTEVVSKCLLSVFLLQWLEVLHDAVLE